MNAFVFLGPTMGVDEARVLLDAVYLPPVAMGDVYRLMSRRPKVIAIIDGVFEATPAVWHKEILFALDQGVRVLGSSSMGALRAAELHTYGMEGIGQIFENYRDGVFEDDDEVALIHGPATSGYRALSEPMVNIRKGLQLARSRGIISEEAHHSLLNAMKDVFYPERSWAALFDKCREIGVA